MGQTASKYVSSPKYPSWSSIMSPEQRVASQVCLCTWVLTTLLVRVRVCVCVFARVVHAPPCSYTSWALIITRLVQAWYSVLSSLKADVVDLAVIRSETKHRLVYIRHAHAMTRLFSFSRQKDNTFKVICAEQTPHC